MVSASVARTIQLLEDYRDTGDAGAREQLAVNYMPLVRTICRRFHTSREPQEDLFQTGMIGLLNAIEKFDPHRGSSFSSLAIPEVLGAILDYLRDHGSLMKVPRTLRRNKLTIDKAAGSLACSLGHWPTVEELAEACQLSEKEIQEAAKLSRMGELRSLDEAFDSQDAGAGVTLSDCVGRVDEGFDHSLDRLTLATALDTLSPREKAILKLRFFGELSQRQIAQRVSMSQMHVSRLERAALQKLRLLLQQSPASFRTPGDKSVERVPRLSTAS